MKKVVEKRVVFGDKTYVFIIDEKDIKFFENAKEGCLDDIYFLIENLDFMQVEFDIVEWEGERI